MGRIDAAAAAFVSALLAGLLYLSFTGVGA
jgi:hypothetical protein